jgi:NhaA family Na+:H+ antiporter
MATDVAFTLAVLSLLGSRVPTRLRIFLLALAIADDVGSVVVLAVVGRLHVGGSTISAAACAAGALVAVLLTVVSRRRAAGAWAFIVLGLALWWLLAHLGVEPTLAGVAVGALVPTGERPELPGLQLERVMAPLSSFVVLPLFALVAAGVDLGTRPWRGNLGLVSVLLVARTLGKAGGILLACLIAVRLGFGRLPRSITWGQLSGSALLCGIGFTVPLLFAEHAFAGHPSELAATKVALLLASVLCAVAGLLVLQRKLPRR